MATAAEWLEGARPRTLLLAPASVIVGTGVAAYDGELRVGRALLALVVALALQVGVNYANDYSDGVRGTDADRVGPLRLVGSGAALPATVLRAAFACFAVAAAAGLVLAVLATRWLLLVGAASIAAAWFYTGGSRPYGYRALGEVFVFAFFGPVATVGTSFVQTDEVSATAVVASVAPGLLACAVLVANNLRDIPGDTVAGKRTLAVVMGPRRSRNLYALLVAVPFLVATGLGVFTTFWALLPVASVPLAVVAVGPVLAEAEGRELIPTLRATGILALAFGLLLGVGLGLAGLT